MKADAIPWLKGFVVAFVLWIFQACSLTKYVKYDEFLLEKNDIVFKDSVPKYVKKRELDALILQKPNTRSVGLYLPLTFYNFGNLYHHETVLNWMKNNPKTYDFMVKTLSQKQANSLLRRYEKLHKWFLKNGEAPVIFDEKKAQKSAQEIKEYLFNHGYFKAKVAYKLVLNVHKVKINYQINAGQPYLLDTVKTDIAHSELQKIYQQHVQRSFLKPNTPYNDLTFTKEADRLVALFRNNGFYYFSKDDIRFHDIDTLAKHHKTDVRLVIKNKMKRRKVDIFKKYRIGKVRVFTDFTSGVKDTVGWYRQTYNGIDFYRKNKEIKYRASALQPYVAIKSGETYKDSTLLMTQRGLERLKNFKYVKVSYTPRGADLLDVGVFLNPQPKYAFQFNTEVINSNIKQVGISGGGSLSSRNLLKGAEIFRVSLQGSVFQLANRLKDASDFFDAWEFIANFSLEIPRWWLPWGHRLMTVQNRPKTFFSNSISFQNNIGLDKQRLTSILSYSWQKSRYVKHQIDLFNLEYVRNLNTESYFNIFASELQKIKQIPNDDLDTRGVSPTNAVSFIRANINGKLQTDAPSAYLTLQNILNRYQIITADNIVPSIGYTFIYNDQKHFKDFNYRFLKVKTQFSKSPFSSDTYEEIKIAQFFKVDVDFKNFWQFGRRNVLGFRFFTGVVTPIQDSAIPFVNSYFVGGTNDVRAWTAYSLGAGGNPNQLEFNVANFKMLTSLEYRFGITNKLEGALFTDVGNIWNFNDAYLTSEVEKMQSFADFKNVAVGSGFGLRYNFDFLLLRLDWAFKTYEPYLQSNKWFQHYNFAHAVWNIGFNYPF